MAKSSSAHKAASLVAIVLLCAGLLLAGIAWLQSSLQETFRNPVATGFLNDMLVHHDQAVTMAMLGAMKGSPEIKATSLKIIRGQSLEMGLMQAWARPPLQAGAAPEAPMMSWMADHYAQMDVHIPAYDQFIQACQTNPAQMPGMASLQDLQHLNQAAGFEFDSKWLQLMINHHEAATIMVQFAQEFAETAKVRTLASAMLREQLQESAYLVTLAKRGALEMSLQSADQFGKGKAL